MTDQNPLFQSKKPVVPPNFQPVSHGVGGAERGSVSASREVSSSSPPEMEMPSEVKEAGLEAIPDHGTVVEIPPDLKKMGVAHAGPTTPVVSDSPSSPLYNVKLPVTDSTVAAGLHTSVASALAWLAVWCVRKLKKAHVNLKVSGNKTTRIKYGNEKPHGH